MPTLFPDPFDALQQFQQALDSFRTSGWLSTGPSAGGAYPPINVFRKGDDLVAIAEVPGIQKSDLEIQVVGRTIRVAGSKSVEYGDKAALHRRERLAGRHHPRPAAGARERPCAWDATRQQRAQRAGVELQRPHLAGSQPDAGDSPASHQVFGLVFSP